MNTISIPTAKPYLVHIGKGILATAGEILRSLTKASNICIISDSNVFPLYGDALSKNLYQAGFSVYSYVISAGENSKSASVYLELLNFLACNAITRSDCVIALGGGVVGDLAGFAAATYLRGIDYIQIPTSLLAMVDSSVGGKTAINLPAGKNLAGAFWQPLAVICDIDTVQTLPSDQFRNGCGEVIKYAILFDSLLFSHLEKYGMGFNLESVISRCVKLKADVVAQDERESGARKLLNLGHTIGHAIEKCSDYAISHGQAVAMGIAILCRSIHCPDTVRITALLQQFGLPTTTHFSPEALYKAALSDKKRSADTVDLIIPDSIGHCVIAPFPVKNLKSLIEEGI